MNICSPLAVLLLLAAVAWAPRHPGPLAQMAADCPARHPVPEIPDDFRPQVEDEMDAREIIISDPRHPARFRGGLLLVWFSEGTSLREMEQAIWAICGKVMGGVTFSRASLYVVNIPNEGSADALFSALETIRAVPQVHHALPEYIDPFISNRVGRPRGN